MLKIFVALSLVFGAAALSFGLSNGNETLSKDKNQTQGCCSAVTIDRD